MSSVRAFAFAATVAALQAQSQVVVYDAPAGHNLTYDQARHRLVRLGFRGDISEFDGTRWRRRPIDTTGANNTQSFVYDETRRLAVRVGAGTNVQGYDGAAWHQLPSFNPLSNVQAVFDPARRELLAIGWSGFRIETWALRGSAWTQLSAQTGVPARHQYGLAADRARGRVVLFGGATSVGSTTVSFNDTWEWDGANWTEQQLGQSPSPRRPLGMVYDEARQRIVLFGGLTAAGLDTQVHEYDGTTWQQAPLTSGWPAASRVNRIAFDTQRGETVLLQENGGMKSWNGLRWLSVAPPEPAFRAAGVAAFPAANGSDIFTFGGVTATPVAHAQTWHWDGKRWTDVSTPGPAPRQRPAVCASATDGYMFGGFDFGAALADFWRWDGSQWHSIPGAGPSARQMMTMAYDPVRSEVVLFGGNGNPQVGGIPGPALADTWVFDGTSWQQRQPAVSPTPRWAHGMTFDHTHGVVILGGGVNGTLSPVSGTWQWDGTNWAQASAIGPDGGGSMAYDVQRGQVLSWDGDEIAAWTGTAWNHVAYTAAEPFTSRHILCGWPYTAGTILVSEVSSVVPGSALLSLSQWNPAAAPYGTGCGPMTSLRPIVAANGWPRIDDPAFGIEVSSGPSNNLVAVIGALQSANVPLGACTLLVQPGQLLALLPTSPTGFATMALPLPNATGLLGVDVFFQAARLDPAATGGFTTSRGLKITLGN